MPNKARTADVPSLPLEWPLPCFAFFKGPDVNKHDSVLANLHVVFKKSTPLCLISHVLLYCNMIIQLVVLVSQNSRLEPFLIAVVYQMVKPPSMLVCEPVMSVDGRGRDIPLSVITPYSANLDQTRRLTRSPVAEQQDGHAGLFLGLRRSAHGDILHLFSLLLLVLQESGGHVGPTGSNRRRQQSVADLVRFSLCDQTHSTYPGQMQLTLIPMSAHSIARHLASKLTAPYGYQ